MNTSELEYKGELRTSAQHVYSGTVIFTDAPIDNHGKAESFSPTDLIATGLAACIITTIGIWVQTNNIGIDLKGTRLAVRKVMAAEPRRIARIEVDIDVPLTNLEEGIRLRMERIAHGCPVAKSLHPEIVQQVSFRYGS